MNAWTLIANAVVFLSFVVHTFVGDKELKVNEPEKQDPSFSKKIEKWTMARCGWHMVSFDLLFASIGLALVNFTDVIKDELFVLSVISIYFLSYSIVWLLVIIISKPFASNYLKLGQWLLLLAISFLTYMGI